MFDEWDDGDKEKCFQQDLEVITTAIDLAEHDTGAALAYIYVGNNPATAMQIKHMNVYAMVRPDEDEEADLRMVDYFLPVVMITPQEEDNLRQEGFSCVGFIDNHYSDVFGLCGGDIDGAMECYAQNFTVALYSRLESISEDHALTKKNEWQKGIVFPDDAKGDVLHHMNVHKYGLASEYLAYLKKHPNQRLRHG